MLTANPAKARPELRCGRFSLPVGERTLVMGILNVTPDSFSDGGRYLDPEKAVERGLQMEADGADIIDIGGESTRPGAEVIPENEEIRRVSPVIESLADKLKIPISIDTRKSAVARAAVHAGAGMINDISGLKFDHGMAELAADLAIPVVVMHASADPSIMQSRVDYDDLISDIYTQLEKSLNTAVQAGIDPSQVIVDPGIGFGKTVQQNFTILKDLERFREIGSPLLVGVSRKSFIGKTLNVEEPQRLIGTAAAVTACVMNGADIVRVHDVRVMIQAVRIAEHIRQGQ